MSKIRNMTPDFLMNIDPHEKVTVEACKAAIGRIAWRDCGSGRESDFQYLKAILAERNRQSGLR